jgi:dephospho-CoA kinase
MVKVGVTGGIGCGKSLVCNIFKQLGIPVFNADIEAKKLLFDNNIKNKITSFAGIDILNTDNQIDKKLFATKLFNNPFLIKQVNQLIHPLVINNFNLWAEQQQNCPLRF